MFINFYCVVSLVVLVPLAWVIPESPRWLEAHGHHDAAERITTQLEAECLRRSGLPSLPEPDYAKYTVIAARHVPVRELFRGQYGRRSILLLIAWTLGYSGMIYGFGGYETLLLRGFGLTSGQAFGVILVSSTVGGGGGLAICAALGEAVERRMIILASVLVTCVSLIVLYFVHTVVASYVLVTLSWGATEVWLFSMYNLHHGELSDPSARHRHRPDRRCRPSWRGVRTHCGRLAVHCHSRLWPCRLVRLRDNPRCPDPALLIGIWGIDQRRAILEHISV